jgi:GNAT superfamily N-acetyltransferase
MPAKTSDFIFSQQKPITHTYDQNIKIRIVTTKPLFQSFYKLVYSIYENNKYWVPPLWKETEKFFRRSNPYWTHATAQLYIAYQNTKPVGRIAALIDHNLPKEEKKSIGYFGFFESINNQQIAQHLLEAAQTWLKKKQISIMRGPINGRIDLGSGFVTKGYTTIPYLMGTYNPEYYIAFMEQFNLQKSRDLISYHIDLKKPILPIMKKTAEMTEKTGVHIRPFNRLHFKKEITLWYNLLLEMFSDHYGYTPSSHEEMENTFGIKELPFIMNPRLFLFAELNGETIGFRFSLPDYNPILQNLNGKIGVSGFFKFISQISRIDRGRFIIMGIKKEHRGKGIGTAMNYYTLLEMKRKGYKTAEYGWIDETNLGSRKAGEKMGGTVYKTYRVYEKNI